MTPNEATEALVTDSLNLLHTLGRIHGGERAMEMWETMGQVLGADIKHRVFMMMLQGAAPTRVRMRRAASGSAGGWVDGIRSLRTATGWDLKQAREIWDRSAVQWVSIPCRSHELGRNLRLELRNLGIEVV